jgi:uncharacterized protein YprB with RNaseH-like and TPR domain
VDGLDPVVAPVVAVAVVGSDLQRVLTGPEPQVLAALDDLMASLPPGVVVTWNGTRFDLPFLAERGRRTGLGLGLRIGPGPSVSWHGHRHLDGYRLYRADVGRVLGFPCGLKALARMVGLETVEVDRRRVHALAPEDLRAYVCSDAHLARALVLRRWPAARVWADPLPAAPSPVAAR